MSGYEYGNTRLRAIRARLFTRADYVDLMGAGSLDRMLAMLSDTPYSSDVEESLVRGRGLDRLDRALRSNLAAALRKMASFYEDRPREMVDLLLSRWDLSNLRTLIRVIDSAMKVGDATPFLVPAGRLGESELAELAAQSDVSALVDLLVVWEIPSPESRFALLAARSSFAADGDSAALQLVVHREYAGETDRVLGSRGDLAARLLRSETDVRNLELALRLRAGRLDGEPVWPGSAHPFLDGGNQDPDFWEEVAESDSAEAVAESATTASPIPGWERAVSTWVEDDDDVQLRDGLRRAITATARSLFVVGDPLGFDVPLGYTLTKEAEVRNLRLVGRALVHRIPMSRIEDRLEAA